MNIFKKRWFTLLISALALLVVSCGSVASATTAKKEPTTLQVHRVNLIPQNHYLPFSPRTLTSRQSILQLYDAIQSLPQSPSGVRHCPADLGLEYQLDFFQGQTPLQSVTVGIKGCQLLEIGKQDVRTYDEAFLQLLAQTLGVTEAELAPMPLSSCTPHSPCPS